MLTEFGEVQQLKESIYNNYSGATIVNLIITASDYITKKMLSSF